MSIAKVQVAEFLYSHGFVRAEGFFFVLGKEYFTWVKNGNRKPMIIRSCDNIPDNWELLINAKIKSLCHNM